MRIAVLLLALVVLVHPMDPARAAPAPGSTLSGTDADHERTMQGPVDAHAQEAVSRWLRANPRGDLTLRLDSPGGSVKYGLLIYKAIGDRGHVTTEIASGQACLSACSFIWLAGQARSMGAQAVLGIHSSACTGPCDPRTVAVVNQVILDILAHTEPGLAVLVSQTSAMLAGNHLIVLARREQGRWAVRTLQPPTVAVAEH